MHSQYPARKQDAHSIPSCTNYSLSIAGQENALRVTSVMPGTSGKLAAARETRRALPATPATQPTTAHDDSTMRQTERQFSQPRRFSRRSRGQEKLRQILLQRFAATRPKSNGSFSSKVQNRSAEPHIATRWSR